jgi:hypothetical protein
MQTNAYQSPGTEESRLERPADLARTIRGWTIVAWIVAGAVVVAAIMLLGEAAVSGVRSLAR